MMCPVHSALFLSNSLHICAGVRPCLLSLAV
uniref:Uncharacterized protein n=1 Tax=Anopheles arabiensis TaxID=7173 RepID=A0A182IG02_ANOAR